MPLSSNQVWWTRLDHAAERQGLAGSKAIADWVHDILPVLAAEDIGHDLVDGRWVEIPPERFTEEYIDCETQLLTDELGVRLGVGPMPGPGRWGRWVQK